MSNFRGAITIGSVLFTSSAMSGSVGVIEEIQLPAMASFDYAAGMLGLVYGVDPSTPDISATGRVSSSGFDWTVAGATYLGRSLDWSATGTYDSTVHSVRGTGDGLYDAKTWTMTGRSRMVVVERIPGAPHDRHRRSRVGLHRCDGRADVGQRSRLGSAQQDHV